MSTHTSARPASTQQAQSTAKTSDRFPRQGDRWTLSRDYHVRFTLDGQRAFRSENKQRNGKTVLQVHSRNGSYRPSDAILSALLEMMPHQDPALSGRRVWHLKQNVDGWAVILKVTTATHGTLEFPLRITMPARNATTEDLQWLRKKVDRYWHFIDSIATDPDSLQTVSLQLLKEARSSSTELDLLIMKMDPSVATDG